MPRSSAEKKKHNLMVYCLKNTDKFIFIAELRSSSDSNEKTLPRSPYWTQNNHSVDEDGFSNIEKYVVSDFNDLRFINLSNGFEGAILLINKTLNTQYDFDNECKRIVWIFANRVLLNYSPIEKTVSMKYKLKKIPANLGDVEIDALETLNAAIKILRDNLRNEDDIETLIGKYT